MYWYCSRPGGKEYIWHRQTDDLWYLVVLYQASNAMCIEFNCQDSENGSFVISLNRRIRDFAQSQSQCEYCMIKRIFVLSCYSYLKSRTSSWLRMHVHFWSARRPNFPSLQLILIVGSDTIYDACCSCLSLASHRLNDVRVFRFESLTKYIFNTVLSNFEILLPWYS